jgi:hypothetical protein
MEVLCKEHSTTPKVHPVDGSLPVPPTKEPEKVPK